MDDACELPAGAAGFTATGQNGFLNGPNGFLMVLEWRRGQRVKLEQVAVGFLLCMSGKFHISVEIKNGVVQVKVKVLTHLIYSGKKNEVLQLCQVVKMLLLLFCNY